MTEYEFRTGTGAGKPKPDAATIARKIDDVTAIAISPGNAHVDHYMRGMANGLLIAQSIAHGDTEPKFIEASAVAEFDYMAEADKTCSIVFNPQNVDRDAFVDLLRRMVEDGRYLNIAKKLLFRGKTPEECGTSQPKLYESLAVEFDPVNPMPGEVDMLHGLVGVITEAAEMAEVLLNKIEHGQFDEVNINEECGDVTWYIARQLRGISAKRGVEVTFEAMQQANIDKLHGRHGEAFDIFRDANRDLKTERVKLEAALPLLEDTIVQGIVKPVAHGEMADMIDRIAEVAHTPRERNDPPLPPGISVGTGSNAIDTDKIG